MRTIMNISLPASLADMVKEEVKSSGYSSVSEFVRELIRDWSKQRAIKEVFDAEDEVRKGKVVQLQSLSDLR